MPYLPLDESTWDGGQNPADYFQSLGHYKHLVLSLFRDAAVGEEDAGRVAEVLPAERERLRFVVMTEDWCGDSATTLPYIARLAEALSIPIRVFRQSRNPHMKRWFADRGTDHIPVVSLAVREAEDSWREAMRWVERPEAAHGRLKEWTEDHPRFEELRARTEDDEDAAKEYFNVYAKLLRDMASWYRNGLWSEIAEEFEKKLREQAEP